MYPIKQSTAITVPFFAHDASGDAVTGLTDGSFTKRISKDGAAFGAMTVTVSELENGWYSIPLSTAHSDTLGLLTVVFTNASAKQVNLQFRVHARLPDDLAFPTTSGRSLDVTATGAAGIDWGNVENAGTTVDLSATDINLVDTCTTNTDMLTAAAVNAEVDTALADVNLDHVAGAAVVGTDVVDNSIVARLVSASATADWDDFVNTTDSLQANRDFLSTLDTKLDTIDDFIDTEVAAILVDTAALNDTKIPDTISLANINAEVVDALNVDTYAEPGQGAPAATASLAAKIGYIYKAWRNRSTQTSSQYTLYADDTTTVDQKATVSDDAVTFDKGEVATGP